jgi:hypothetical protein
VGSVHHLFAGREFFLGEDGSVLRTTWYTHDGLVNFTVWRGDRCTESFHLAATDAARLIGFLAEGLSSAAADVITPTEARPVGNPTMRERFRVGRWGAITRRRSERA